VDRRTDERTRVQMDRHHAARTGSKPVHADDAAVELLNSLMIFLSNVTAKEITGKTDGAIVSTRSRIKL
jgi:hypothetical protein